MTYLEWEKQVETDFPANMLACIERFLSEVHPRLEPGRDFYQEVFDTDLFFPLQRQAELAAMMRIARGINIEGGGPEVVMEIGADKGGGLYHWCKCLPSVRQVIACEIRGTPYAALFETAFPSIDFCWLEGSSRSDENLVSVADDLAAWGTVDDVGARSVPCGFRCMQRAKIDALFIDGDKSAFLADFDAYLPLMSPRGVVFMHDINEPLSPMRRAWIETGTRGYKLEQIIDVSDFEEARRRERNGNPPRTPHEAWLRHWAGRSCGVGVIWMEGRKG